MDKSKKEERPETVLEEGVDYYRDGSYIVFTEHYHLKRGSCCGSGCRHCPYRKPADKRNRKGR